MPPIKEKPIKMFIYQPVYLEEKEEVTESEEPKRGRPKKGIYVCCTITKFPYCRVEIDDVFTSEKRPDDYAKLENQNEFKVVAVRYNLVECACIVILEKKMCKSKEEIDRFVSGKGCV